MPRESKRAKIERAQRLFEKLEKAHPDAHCELDHEDAYQLLVATILAAQNTDRNVNTITPKLFRRYPDAKRLSRASPATLERMVHSTGFFRQKTRALLAMAQAVVEDHEGEIPGTLEELVKLPGVGRKTANVILGNCFDTPGLVVDTHVTRLAHRLGLTREKDAVKIERDLCALLPEATWTRFSHAAIFHGRRVCHARRPECETCPLPPDCPYPKRPVRRSSGAPSRARA